MLRGTDSSRVDAEVSFCKCLVAALVEVEISIARTGGSKGDHSAAFPSPRKAAFGFKALSLPLFNVQALRVFPPAVCLLQAGKKAAEHPSSAALRTDWQMAFAA